jgi:hypothetical protein
MHAARLQQEGLRVDPRRRHTVASFFLGVSGLQVLWAPHDTLVCHTSAVYTVRVELEGQVQVPAGPVALDARHLSTWAEVTSLHTEIEAQR